VKHQYRRSPVEHRIGRGGRKAGDDRKADGMIPGFSGAVETRLAAILDPAVTDTRAETLYTRPFTLFAGRSTEARALGISATGEEVMVVVTDPARRLGSIHVHAAGHDCVLFFDNLAWGGNCHATIRMLGDESALLFNDIGDAYVMLADVFMRSHRQFLFWGAGASAVGLSIELEGEEQGAVIGDDALISGGVWIRNYDMHAIHDLATGARINRQPITTIIERHVWLGQDALLLSTERVAMGAIVGARALVKGQVPPRVAVAGTPARVLREGVSWGRSGHAMTARERAAIGLGPV
jgi:hypothetical protein